MNNNCEKKKRRKQEDHWEGRPQVTIKQGTIKINKTKGLAHFSRLKTQDNCWSQNYTGKRDGFEEGLLSMLWGMSSGNALVKSAIFKIKLNLFVAAASGRCDDGKIGTQIIYSRI